jgi:hypothetical protein
VRTSAEPLVHFFNRVCVEIVISRPTTGIQTENVRVASTRGERRRAGAHSATRERVLKKWVAVDWAGGGRAGRRGAGRQAGKKSGSN